MTSPAATDDEPVRAAILAAMDRLLDGTPQQSEGRLSVSQLAAEAGVKRWHLTHQHTDLKDFFQARVRRSQAGQAASVGFPSYRGDIALKEERAMAETRRKFDRDFREGAVRLVRETGKPIAQVARDLGINSGTLGNWVNADRSRRGGDGTVSEDERAGLARLRKENAELAMRCDVLKRSVALWVLCEISHKTHYAEGRIMPAGLLYCLLASGSASR